MKIFTSLFQFAVELVNCFYFCPANGRPAIQIGKPGDGIIIFWLKYDDVAMNKLAGDFIETYGNEIYIHDLRGAKKYLLAFISDAFACLDANFLSLNPDNDKVKNILNSIHIKNIEFMLSEKIKQSQIKMPYIYTIKDAKLDGNHTLSNTVQLFGNNQFNELENSIKKQYSQSVNLKLINNQEPFSTSLYKRDQKSIAVLIYAISDEDAEFELNKFFGALCISIKHPFQINAAKPYKLFSRINKNSITTYEIRINIPSLLEINLTNQSLETLAMLLSTTSERVASALTFIAHGWSHDLRERFINHFISLDALYGTEKSNKLSIVNGVSHDAKEITDISEKIKIIYELRSKFIHGEIPSLHKHTKYLSFVQNHGLEPVSTLYEIVSTCIRNHLKKA